LKIQQGKNKIITWKFIGKNNELLDANRPIVKVGIKSVIEDPKLDLRYAPDRSSRMYSSFSTSLEALMAFLANGPNICKAKISGEILNNYPGGFLSSEFEPIFIADVTSILHELACWCAEQYLDEFETKYPNEDNPRKAIKAKRDWLNKKISDEDLSSIEGDTLTSAFHIEDGFFRNMVMSAAFAADKDVMISATFSCAWHANRDETNKKIIKTMQNQKLESMIQTYICQTE
jgi:hypothetical protein